MLIPRGAPRRHLVISIWQRILKFKGIEQVVPAHFAVRSEVLSADQHKLGALATSIFDCHQLRDPGASSRVVTCDLRTFGHRANFEAKSV
jgi:hypothetical protein